MRCEFQVAIGKRAKKRRSTWPVLWRLACALLAWPVIACFSGCHSVAPYSYLSHRSANPNHQIISGEVLSRSRRSLPHPTKFAAQLAGHESTTNSPESDSNGFHSLPVVPAKDRPALQFAEGMQEVKGRLVEVGDSVRILTLEDAEILAAGNSEAASHIYDQRKWLKCKPGITPSLLESLEHQEKYERNRSAADAVEAFFQLAEIDAQLPILDQSILTLEKAEAAILKVHQAGLPIEQDTKPLARRRIELERKREDLVYNRKLVSGKLALLLNLDPDSKISLWASFRPRPVVADVEVKRQVEIAFQNRGDLLGIESLALTNNPKSLNQLRQVSGGKAPVLAISPSPLGPARWWQHRLQAQLECLRQKEFAQRKKQLARLAKSQRKMIRAEVQGILLGIEKSRGEVRAIGRTIDSLNQSISAAEKAKDFRPINFPEYLGWKLEVLNLTSQSIHQLVKIQIDKSKLQAAQGILGKKSPGAVEFANTLLR